ncbi:MAG: trypsin-like peptidase domain-containing protein [Sphingobacteriia bacterium]|nr:trypsin-like peptidase domain-containing protein [Sphingobacteriia bacterium]
MIAGTAICNALYPNYKGTAGCFLQKEGDNNSIYLLTCSHIMTNGNSQDFNGVITNAHRSAAIGYCNNRKQPIGKWVYAVQNKNLDIALVEIKHTGKIVLSGFKRKPRFISQQDIALTKKLKVSMSGSYSGVKTGIIKKVNQTKEIIYTDGERRKFNNLIVIQNENDPSSSFACKGDSGAVVFDSERNIIGMIVAGDVEYSYAMPMKPIIDYINMVIIG